MIILTQAEMIYFNNTNHPNFYSSGFSGPLNRVANDSNSSIFTIEKIQNIILQSNSQSITAKDLASKLNVTLSYANKILKQLTETGYAEITTTSSLSKRGRPSRLYKINFMNE